MAKPAIPPITVTIAAATNLSPSIDLTAGSIAYIVCPDVWDAADISFQVSVDNINFYDLFDNEAYEVIRPVVPGGVIALNAALTQPALHAKIRSGSRADPVTQTADRIFTLVLV
jgi:hypothetical protein